MGKAGFWLRGSTGKFAGSTLYRGKGGTIQREIVKVSNPKTTGQMRQRALFASVVKFYKHANQRFFKFAFEDKKQTESDYNAFVRHNVKRGVIQPYEVQKDELQPALGQNWQLTQGSLSTPIFSMDGQTNQLSVEGVSSSSTWPQIVEAICNQYGLQVGDFITYVAVQSFVKPLGTAPQFEPKWIVKQIVLNPSITPADFGEDLVPDIEALDYKMGTDNSYACGYAVIFSRNITGSGVKVSTSHLENNAAAQAMVDILLDEDAINGNLASWGATGKAILQGSLVERTTALVPEFVGFRGAGNNVVDAFQTLLTGVGDSLTDNFIPGIVNYVIIAGSNLEALDVNKFSCNVADVAIELHRDAVYGYYLTLDVEETVSSFTVTYDGSDIFDTEA